jgi:hypothetical protein
MAGTAVLDPAHLGDITGAFGSISRHDHAPRRSWPTRLRTLLAIMGPGLIVMVADNDAGGIATYAQAGQNHGTRLLWVLALLLPVLVVSLAFTAATLLPDIDGRTLEGLLVSGAGFGMAIPVALLPRRGHPDPAVVRPLARNTVGVDRKDWRMPPLSGLRPPHLSPTQARPARAHMFLAGHVVNSRRRAGSREA